MTGARLVLASASPRRARLLDAAGFAFDVVPSRADETVAPGTPPRAAALGLAERKARAVEAGDRWVLAADTLLDDEGRIVGKPRDEADARRMLARLSGREHAVLTGVAVRRGDALWSAVETTRVRFRNLSAGEIEAYVATGEPLDKAGAYAVQGGARGFVASIEGPLDNVIGLPMGLVGELLRRAGFPAP